MASSLRFATREDVVRALSKCPWRQWFDDARKHRWTLEDAVRVSVGPNTFRYFRHLPAQPSVVFRSWAARAVTPQVIDTLCLCDSQAAYDRLLRALVASLRGTWLHAMRTPIQVGPAIKLPSLLLKHLCASIVVPDSGFRCAARFLHTPLDSYTLAAIRTVHNRNRQTKAYVIPYGAGMGWVSTWPQYNSVQTTIQDCAAQAGVPGIAFDVLAWNHTHR